jgi:hypothetical protein
MVFSWESDPRRVELPWWCGGDLVLLRLPEEALDVFGVCQHDEVGWAVPGMFYAGLATRWYLVSGLRRGVVV